MIEADIQAAMARMSAEEIHEVNALLAGAKPWYPLPGPQTMAYMSHADVIGFGGAAGGGKGLALDTPIPTPSGWAAMGSLRVGDRVFAPDGAPCVVTAATEPTMRRCFRLVFDDGAVIVADDVHRWVTFDAAELSALSKRTEEYREARRAKRPSRAKAATSKARLAALSARNATHKTIKEAPQGTMRDTAELHTTLRTAAGRANHAIPCAGALVLPEAALLIAPYTLGAWLGDGSSRNSQLTGADAGVWQRIESEGYRVVHYKWSEIAHNILGLQAALRTLGVQGIKHIPGAYLRASYSQRLALLQGLMDTDGHAAVDGGCEYDGVNYALVKGVFDLVISLGIKATLQAGTAKLNGRVIGDKWRVQFTTSLPVFGLPRKLARLKQTTRRTTRMRYLVACESVGMQLTRCIAVDHPTHQYLASEHMVPTHNTDLAVGKCLTQFKKCAIFRREGTELTGIMDRFVEIVGHTEGYNGSSKIWRDPVPGVQLEFGSTPNLGDEKKYQGRPKELLVIDEAANFLEAQVRFLMGWVRTTEEGRRCQTLMTFNPPTDSNGRWLVRYFAPWLDRKHPNPAKPGELRWFAVIDGKDTEVPSSKWFEHDGEMLRPSSRTFVPSRVQDNPYLMGTNYMTTLQALPEPLRSQMLNGDFEAGMQDDAMQVIPTAWVEAAMARWTPQAKRPPMLSMGIDVARGGKDNTIIATRHAGGWFAEPCVHKGTETPDGPTVAGLTIAACRDGAPMHIDVIGVGASPYDFLLEARQHVIGVNVSERADAPDRSGRLRFHNKRSELWWRMREALEPSANTGIALPPNSELKADLCAPTWTMRGASVLVMSREDMVTKLGRSPDYASAYLLALIDTPTRTRPTFVGGVMGGLGTQHGKPGEYDPYAHV